MDIRFDCSHCGQALEVDDAGAGETVDCPKCRKPVYIPTNQPQSEPAAPRVPKAPRVVEAVEPRVPQSSSPYAKRIKELLDEDEERRKLERYVVEPGINQWKALKLASQIIKALAVLTLLGFLVYPIVAWWLFKTAMSPLGLTAVPAARGVGIVLFLYSALSGVIAFGGLWVTADLILLLVSVEQNTTRTVALLRGQKN